MSMRTVVILLIGIVLGIYVVPKIAPKLVI